MKEEQPSFEIRTKTGQSVPAPQLRQIRQLGRDAVFEPFEGKRGLETLQQTRIKIEEKTDKLKDASAKAGKWFTDSKILAYSKSKFSDGAASGFFKGLTDRLDRATEDLRQLAKDKYHRIEDAAKEVMIAYTQKGLEYLIEEDVEAWVAKRTRQILKRKDVLTLSEMRRLTTEERSRLVEALYPFDFPILAEQAKALDRFVNVSLGVVVATNIPGTGLAVSLINMGKTLVKIALRLKIMSGIHGYRIENPKALFCVSALILKSLSDWESNPDHEPLDPDVLAELYRPAEQGDEDGFRSMISEIVKKEAYIAVPGVGMISLGKINLDDVKLDLVIKNLVENHFAQKQLLEFYGGLEVGAWIEDFKTIYTQFHGADLLRTSREKKDGEKMASGKEIFKNKLKSFIGADEPLDEVIEDLDRFALEIFSQVHMVHKDKKIQTIREEIERRIGEMGT